ncbi:MULTISPECIES: ankyrin repeat domain-containing protein [unclassified Mycobacterium]|uniref:ankyrin repeat domain-containing protein n=1 Tax=unclassified Mycobacterium TaxID=2642494 RepID=UPI000B15F615|nr:MULTISPECIES: ankyrin repeat domain-containing protein [unclassified Mycobacterium]
MNNRDRAGRTPLHYAAIDAPVGLNHTAALTDPVLRADNHRKLVDFMLANSQRLLAAGADVNAVDSEGSTPLHFAARGISAAVVRLLLDAGAEVNATNTKGESPLYCAIRNTTPAALDITRLLCDRGADPTIQTANGSSALRFVKLYGTPEQKEVFADFL